MKCPALALLALFLAGATGCADTVRDRMDGFRAEVWAWGTGGAVARAHFSRQLDDSTEYLTLGSDDSLYFEPGVERVKMSEQTTREDPVVFNAPFYRGESGVDTADDEVRIVLETDGFSDLEAKGTLPQPFEITSGTRLGEVSRSSDTLEVTWEPRGWGTTEFFLWMTQYSDTCVGGLNNVDQRDSGTLVIQPGDTWSRGPFERTCRARLELRRCVEGESELPRQQERPALRLCQVRAVEFTSTP